MIWILSRKYILYRVCKVIVLFRFLEIILLLKLIGICVIDVLLLKYFYGYNI